jgi:hypothetical protein
MSWEFLDEVSRQDNLQGMAFGQLGELFRADLASLQLLRQQTGEANLHHLGDLFGIVVIRERAHHALL